MGQEPSNAEEDHREVEGPPSKRRLTYREVPVAFNEIQYKALHMLPPLIGETIEEKVAHIVACYLKDNVEVVFAPPDEDENEAEYV